MSDLVVCESVAAITTHLRIVTVETPISLSGFHPRPTALCGMEVAWDTKIPTRFARCKACRREAGMQ